MKRRFADICAVVALAGAALASQAVWAQQHGPAQPQRTPEPIVIKPGERPEDVCRGDPAGLTCDITSHPRRGGINVFLRDVTTVIENPNSGLRITDYNIMVEAMKETARNGWVADRMIGELAARNISRVSFFEENGQVQHDAQGNPLIKLDRAQNLAARIVEIADNEPQTRMLQLGGNIRPIPINKPRVCLAAFADVNMSLPQNTSTAGQPSSVANTVVAQAVSEDRKSTTDSQLHARVAEHLANRSNVSLSEVAADCARLGLRQLHDEGFRYTGHYMTTPARR